MSTFDVETINKLLERPGSADDHDKPAPASPERLQSNNLGSSADEEEAFAELEPPQQPTMGGQLLDLSKMLEVKKQQQEEKRRRVEAIKEREKQKIVYNPLIPKEFVENKSKEIQNYKNKISQEKYFQSSMKVAGGAKPIQMSPQSNRTYHQDSQAYKITIKA